LDIQQLRFIAGKNDGNLCNRWGKGKGKFSGNIAWPSVASPCDGQRKVALRVDASRYNSSCRHSALADEERCLMGKTDDGLLDFCSCCFALHRAGSVQMWQLIAVSSERFKELHGHDDICHRIDS
jgi:hypothetical protein